jgi:acetoacetyl-CoA synthetase
MERLLWNPSDTRIEQANITRFIDFINEKHNTRFSSYHQLYDWSVEKIPDFWAAMWDYSHIIYSTGYDEVIDDLSKYPGASWFKGARLNFAENLLRYKDDKTALIFKGENKVTGWKSYAGLHQEVANLAKYLRDLNVGPGDRVGAYMSNMMETVIAMLATTSVGAIWASCGAELGPVALLDRIGQIEPKVLFTADGYYYKGRSHNILPNVEKIAKEIPSLENIIVTSYIDDNLDLSNISNSKSYNEVISPGEQQEIWFEQLPFNHPVYIMFSSGTTGKPKCIVQGAGGVLLNHLKELILHADLKREDRIMYITSPSWMMWHWLISSLSVGATVMLYDGNPTYPENDSMWRLIQDEKITIFGCSASYLNYLRNNELNPGEKYDLSSLRQISQTGSPLSADGFNWVYEAIKRDLHFNSISGGTDINGCFVNGAPILPVYSGELQCPALGMKVKAYDEDGKAVLDQKAELVCEAPSPSMPLYFWDDPENEKYLSAYFKFYQSCGKNVWRHGDYIIIHEDTGGITFYGRSDAILKPSGVRIGTAELYNVVERLPEISDSVAIGQHWKGDQRIILFLKLTPGYDFTDDLKNKIRRTLRKDASPRHVPNLILEAPDIPYTFSMKKVEIAIANIFNGKKVTNIDALINPEALKFYEKTYFQMCTRN